MLALNNLSSPKGSHRNNKRIGRGQGSGRGTQAGKGHKGQKARKSGNVMPGFEGGAMPLYKRLPKRGFKNMPFKKEFAIVTLEQINTLIDGTEISREILISRGVLKGRNKKLPLKILGPGDAKEAMVFKGVAKFSKTAEESILKANGKID